MRQFSFLSDKKKVEVFCQKNNLSYLGLFGSTARGDNRPDSDIDLLYEFDSPKSLFQLMNIKDEFEDLIGQPVDLVSKRYIKPLVRPYIERDLITIYEKRPTYISE